MYATLDEVNDHLEIVDALLRFGLGQDLGDRELFASAFAADAELDFRPAAARWGGAPPLMTGRDAIVDTILGLVTGRVDTTHQVTNPRVALDGDRASLTALVEAQHLLRPDRDTHAQLLRPDHDTHAQLLRPDHDTHAQPLRPDHGIPAQPLPPDHDTQPQPPDHVTHALLKNRYAVQLRRDGRRWVIHRMRIENVWFTGEPAAVFG